MLKVLLVEDEVNVASFIQRGLSEAGYEVTVAMDGDTGYSLASAHEFAIILLDVMLPGINGLEVCRRLRQANNNTPVLMLTALGSTENVVTGLDSGADDYLVKPFKFAELQARIRSLTRRNFSAMEKPDMLSMADLVVNTTAKTVQRGGKPIALTATEYRLLEYMLKNQRKVLSRMEILEHVWGIDFNMGTNVVDVYVNYLRKKLDKGGSLPLIHTVIGMGYIMKEMHENSN
ncbi:DNA-binding response OmpR family regulator [Filimonas zeae]|uniref:DNA-binding response regulator n=1 Tax=Filimonas zeae TaxID=1737353 RepID=A0A917MYC4_9BACT|nr:response regulator transcription factor [Filimonas zeae]MDR6342122.1 DNA-binding response OmpR family regulator [Filimonas zeae]GGH79022.1 DNA-binding response regulator [Filimonas zeae]